MSETMYAVLLGILQGITEFLPVSSSGHLILLSSWIDGEPLNLTLNVALHLGTLVAILVYFYKDWMQLLVHAWAWLKPGSRQKEPPKLLLAMVLGTLPAACIGLLFKDQIQLYFHKPMVVAVTLGLVGFFLWYVDKKFAKTRTFEEIGALEGLLVGLAQVFALIPGVSRSGSTIIGGRLLGLGRMESARFSFLLGAPVMAGAALLDVQNILKSLHQPVFYIGTVVAGIVGCVAIRIFLGIIERWGFTAFALYRLFLAGVIVFYNL